MKKIPLVLTALLLCGCAAGNDRSVMHLYFHAPVLKTFSPDVSLDPASFTVYGSGPSDEEFLIETEGYSAEIHEILCGTWLIRIDGLDDDGNRILSGEAETVIRRTETNDVYVILYPVSGTGTLSVRIDWPESTLSEPSVVCSLDGDTGTEVLEMVVDEKGASCADDYPSGYYTLSIILFDHDDEVFGGTETVRIISGFTTEAVFDFTVYDALFRTSVMISAGIDPQYPPPVSIQGPDMVLTGESGLYYASGPGKIEETRWFLDGHYIAEGGTFLLPPDDRKKISRIDAETEDQNGCARGSGTLRVTDITPRWKGDVSYFRNYKNGVGDITLMSGVNAGDGKGKVFAATGYNSDGVVFFSYNPISNKLIFTGAHKHSEITGPCAIAAVSSGYIVAGNKSNSLGLCDPRGYTDVFSDPESVWLSGPRGLTTVEEYIYIVNEDNNTLALFKLNNSVLTPVWMYDFYDVPSGYGNKPNSIKIFDSSSKAAVTFFDSDTLVIFSRNTENGQLEYLTCFKDETEGIDGLNGPSDICVNGDGSVLYVTGYYDDSVSVFSNDGTSIQYTGCVRQGIGSVEDLDMPRGVSLSRSGEYLYVAAGGSDGIAVFSIEETSGMPVYDGLLFPETRPDDMDSPRSVYVMEEYPAVFVCSAGSSTVNHLAVRNYD
ncbi:MAG: lactonase family protein [Spirochaetia bacterium]